MRTINNATLEKVEKCIADYQLTYGASPSYRKIQRAADMSSLNLVRRYVTELESRGRISKTDRGAIALPEALKPSRTTLAPLIGNVACGQPNLSYENVEGSYALPKSIFGNGELMMLKAKGESMVECGVSDGDYVVLRRQDYADNGKIVLASVDGETTLKRFFKRDGKIILHPENSAMTDIETDECEILGVLTACIKVY